ncbi:MAG: glycogen-debranching protein [Actinobacteria bacterium]|nr:glycogen-debranching protein [Actinomycetota bacterium]
MPSASSRWPDDTGTPAPLGVTYLPDSDTYNFALYSTYASRVILHLYRREDPVCPVLSVTLDPRVHKSGRVWHCRIPVTTINDAVLYGYQLDGPFNPAAGHRFDSEKVLLDPYARTIFFPPAYSREACSQPGSTAGRAPLGVLPPRQPTSNQAKERADGPAACPAPTTAPRHGHDTIIYEMHVRGFTMRPNSGVTPQTRGTFHGVIEKIPYLRDLGVTVVELLPVQQFDPLEDNYWGYMTLNFFAPHAGYAAATGGAATETGAAVETGSAESHTAVPQPDPAADFKAMVDALHKAGIEVWLDVVYNHTSEAHDPGPTYCYRGLDNKTYYLLEPGTGAYQDHTGCGNTLRTAHPAVRTLILQSVRHWAEEYSIDGFRFDLASVFTRDLTGKVNTRDPAIIAELSTLGYQHDLVMVAEAWDLAAYQLGRGFPSFSWRQWNGRFRDDLRAFVRGDPGMVPCLIRRLYGSDDLFPDTPAEAYRPFQSINFVTSHDGFCLYDLVSYNQKRNLANGHDNTDGSNENFSWNCGHEGDEGAAPEVLALRRRQAKNFFCLLMLAAGTPQFSAGDEFLNTQGGNNNPYNQDNETTWLDWDLLQRNADVHRFFRLMIAFRKRHPSLGRNHFWREDVRWFGVEGEPDLSWCSRSVAFFLSGASLGDDDLYVMINAWEEDLEFEVQVGEPAEWQRVVDTAQPSPQDIVDPVAPGTGTGATDTDKANWKITEGKGRILVRTRSIVVLERERQL